ncbi:DUF2750 domain-containing protein [Vibrio sp. WJH972]
MASQSEQYAAEISQFISSSQSNKLIWGLRAEDGWLSCESQDLTKEVMPFWSTKEKASQHTIDEWSEFEVIEIPLDIFVEDWLITLDEDDVLIGIDWDENLVGAELEATTVTQLYK